MLELIFITASLIYFPFSVNKTDTCFYISLILSLIHLCLYLLIAVPLIQVLVRKKSISNIYRQYLKITVISTYRMPIFCCGVIILSMVCLYAMIAQLFIWQNYTYLFINFCLICSSLTMVSNFTKIRYDCSIFFSVETYKFFCLAVSSIMFGISAHQTKLSAQILGMGWAYFVYRSKQSLPKQIVYYLILFMDVVILLTAIMVIGSSQNLSNSETSSKNKLSLLFAVSFFGLLFSMQIYQFVQLYRNFGRYSSFSNAPKKVDITQIYLKFQQFKKDNKSKLNNPQCVEESQCAICLQNISQKKHKGQQLILNCGHTYHSGCLQQWVEINQTCPLCRKHLISDAQKSVVL